MISVHQGFRQKVKGAQEGDERPLGTDACDILSQWVVVNVARCWGFRGAKGLYFVWEVKFF